MKNMKRIVILALCFVLMFSLIACGSNSDESKKPDDNPTNDSEAVGDETSNDNSKADNAETVYYVDEGILKVRHFKCGKADAILIRTRTHTFLIDAGEEDDSQDILDYLAKKGITKLDYILLSTYDRDCYGGAAAIIRSVQVDNIIMPGYTKSNDEYKALMSEINKKNISVKRLSGKMTLELDDAVLELEGARTGKFVQHQDDNASIVVSLTHGNVKMLFASSIQSERMYEMLQSGELGKYDYLKVPNFGKFNNNTADFIAAISPKIASISCSEKNPAAKETLDALASAGTQVYLTKDGSVRLTSDGTTISVKERDKGDNE